MNEASIRQTARSAAVICLCFLLTSTGWLSWEYHLLEQIPAEASDIWTMIVGYLLQAAGIGLFALLIRRKEQEARRVFSAALVMHMLFMIPAVISPYTVGTLVFGLLMNLNCGVIAGYYLYDLTIRTAPSRRATAFGLGYGLAILAQWLLSLIGGGSLYYSEGVLLVCLVLTSAVLAAVWKGHRTEGEKEIREPPKAPGKHLLVPVCVLVLLFGIVNSSGFAFPSADLGKTVNVELSRLVYAAGLMIAGIVADRNRRYSAIFALSALMIPFIILALREETVSSVIFWVLSYFTFGFYSVYRITVFSDIAADHNALWLSGFGLMAGRIGDAAGEGVCLAFGARLTLMICLTAGLFVVTLLVFFRVYQVLYVPEYRQEQDEKEKFYRFAMQHDLSAREREMLRLLLDGKTNAEIAGALFISENTVKFHIRNLLQKTGCRNRNELVMSYMGAKQT